MPPPPASSPVVVGVIDDAIAFGHERFRNASGTRVQNVWLQDRKFFKIGNAPPTPLVNYGFELTRGDIDGLIAQCTHRGAVDEDEFYRRAGLVNLRSAGRRRRLYQSAAWRLGHGTHVLDLACGYDPALDVRDRPIVCVQLPGRVTEDTSGAFLHTYALDGIEYILQRSDEIALSQFGVPHLPVVINFSYGTIGGPHDGTSELERAIDEIVRWREQYVGSPLAVVLPSGNNRQLGCHGKLGFPIENGVAEVSWQIMPDDRTPSFLEIWMPHRPKKGASRIKVTLVTPTGYRLDPPIDETNGKRHAWVENKEEICSIQYFHVGDDTGTLDDTDRGMFLAVVGKTSGENAAPCGIWKIRIEDENVAQQGSIQMWIRRDDTFFGHPSRGRQSFFADASNDLDKFVRGHRRDDDQQSRHVRRDRTLNALACGGDPVVIGAYGRQEMKVARYSAGGPTTPARDWNIGYREGVDALAVSDDSGTRRGVLGAGTRSGSVLPMSGTSVAAPQIARRLADYFSVHPQPANPPQIPGPRDVVKKMAQQDETARSGQPPNYTPRSGWGRCDSEPVSRRARDAGRRARSERIT